MKTHILSAVLAVMILGACASKDEAPPRLCPQTAILRELERVRDYGGETMADTESFVAAAKMKSVDGVCEYEEDGVDLKFTLDVAFLKGPRLGGDRASFPFLVAVLNPEGKILAKEIMTIENKFPEDAKENRLTEAFHVFVPLPNEKADASNYQVLLGFQLTEDQLAAERAREAR